MLLSSIEKEQKGSRKSLVTIVETSTMNNLNERNVRLTTTDIKKAINICIGICESIGHVFIEKGYM